MWEEMRPGRREGVGWRRRNRHEWGRLRLKGGSGARAKRTLNMRYIFVTLEVSQFDMSALKFRML